MRQDVDSGDVHRAEGGTLGPADHRARHGVDFLNREVPARELFQHTRHAVEPDPVRDEIGGVLRHHDPLAELSIDERRQRGDHRGIGVAGRNNLDQPEIARRVEEMAAEPVPAERLGTSLRDRADRDAGRVRCDDGVGAAVGLYPFEQGLLRVETLDDRFDDPVAAGNLRQVAVEPTEADTRPCVAREERVRLQCRGALQTGRGGVGVEIEQQHRQAGVRDVCRDLGSHRACPEHRNGANGPDGRLA